MTDKQIIIDGIDVSQCEYYCERYCKQVVDEDGCYVFLCAEDKNCYYKQLKRKEQECEELLKYHNKCCEEFEKEKKEWLEKYNQVSRDFYNGKYCNKENCNLLKAKEQKCEELKKQLQKYKDNYQQEKEMQKLYNKFKGSSLIEKSVTNEQRP